MKKLIASVMKRKMFFLVNIVFLLFVSCGFDTNKAADIKLIPVKNGDLFQYIDTDGKVVITPQFTDATVFRNGLALVRISGEEPIWGYIKEDGKFAITPNYKKATVFSEDLAWVVSDNGFPTAINNKGEEIVKLKNAVSVKIFKEGFAAYSILDDENWGLLDASPFKWGFLDKEGKVIINPQFSNVGNFSNDKCAVQDCVGKWGYIDKAGKMTIKYQFDNAREFHDGKAVVASGGKLGVIDENGNYIINPQFSSMIVDGNNYVIEQNGKWGWCDKAGSIIIKPQFDDANPFLGNDLASIKLGNKYGYINNVGMIEINPQFQLALTFNSGIALVVSDNKVGFIDGKGKFIINQQFDTIGEDYIMSLLNLNISYEAVESDILNEILDPRDIIRNPIIDEKFKKIFETKSQNYIFQKRESNYYIKPKSNNIAYYYVPYTNSIEGYTYFSNRGIEFVKHELKKYGIEFTDDNLGYANGEIGSCYSVQLKVSGNLIAINYGYECD